MTRKQYVVKYNRHTDEYGVYDHAARSVAWGMDLARAASRAAHGNAVNAIGASLNAAIVAITSVLNGPLSSRDRAELRRLRAELSVMRDDVPTPEALVVALAREQAS